MDAITLSTSQLVTEGRLAADAAWRLIVVASLANFLFKGILATVIGGRALFKHLAPAFLAAFVAGIAILGLWPAPG